MRCRETLSCGASSRSNAASSQRNEFTAEVLLRATRRGANKRRVFAPYRSFDLPTPLFPGPRTAAHVLLSLQNGGVPSDRAVALSFFGSAL